MAYLVVFERCLASMLWKYSDGWGVVVKFCLCGGLCRIQWLVLSVWICWCLSPTAGGVIFLMQCGIFMVSEKMVLGCTGNVNSI